MSFTKMGVLNLTPDSFSDGDKNLSREVARKKFIQLSHWAHIIDIGAESTAPFNDSVSEDDELARFEKYFYPILETVNDPQTTISLDTYKIDIFKEVAKKITQHWPGSNLIFNDVSGVLDDQILRFLNDSELKFKYVLAHNKVPTREETSSHIKFASDSVNISNEVISFFENNLLRLKDIKRETILDPCFGFAKTREQNHQLLSSMPRFLSKFSSYDTILGLSRKSFLRFPANLDITLNENQFVLEATQAVMIFNLREFKKRLIIRTHTKSSVDAVDNSLKILENSING